MTGCCKCDNETSVSIKHGITVLVNDCELLEKNCAL